jgi:hypothetical protein
MSRFGVLAFIVLAAAMPVPAAMAASVSARILADANASLTPGGAACSTYAPSNHATTTLGLSRALNCSITNNADVIAALNAGVPANSTFYTNPYAGGLPLSQTR